MTAAPTEGVPVQLTPGRRWQIVLGAVGQPATASPPPPCALRLLRTVEFCRVPYDIRRRRRPIIENRLPGRLAERLQGGLAWSRPISRAGQTIAGFHLEARVTRAAWPRSGASR